MLDTEKLGLIFRESIQSACIDKPSRPSFRVVDGCFVFTIKGNRENWQELCKLMAVPSTAEQIVTGDQLICKWPSVADQIFSPTGLLAAKLPGYEMRVAQLHAGRLLQRGIEQGQPVIVEAGTGTGKSLIYLLITRAMGKKVIVSTSNKALQMQLRYKDAPFVASLFPSRIALVQGKSNYACVKRVEDALEDDKDFLDKLNPALVNWYNTTDSGNIQEIAFETDWNQVNKITVDDCIGKKLCSCIADCFYYKAKAEREQADILICNHMLLGLDERFPMAGILPSADVLVVDEAHQLSQYVSNAYGVEFRLSSFGQHIETLRKYTSAPADIDKVYNRFEGEVKAYAVGKSDEQIGIKTEDQFLWGLRLAALLQEGAEMVWNPEMEAQTPKEKKKSNAAKRIKSSAQNLIFACTETEKGFVRWYTKKANTLTAMPYDVSKIIGGMAGFTQSESTEIPDFTHCARCGRELTASVVHVLSGLPYGPTCINEVDPFGDAEEKPLHEWLAQDHKDAVDITHRHRAVLFTSATLGTPDLEPFMRDHGIPYALQMQVNSPFDYQSNALLYVPDNNAPEPKSAEFLDYMVEQMESMVIASKGGAFLLFTSNAALGYAVDKLRKRFEAMGFPCFVQGAGYSKLEIIAQVKKHGNAVLFATKSFFEGVDVQGDALRLVIIDKMPFAAPNPYTNAVHEFLREWAQKNLSMDGDGLKWYPFNAHSIPSMIIDLKQATGRLIRSHSDRGVMAVLDKRIITTQYGRQKVMPSLPDAKMVRDLVPVQDFFNPKIESTAIAELSPIELAKQLYAIEL